MLVTLAVALVAGGALVVPLAILAPPLALILGGLLVVCVLRARRRASAECPISRPDQTGSVSAASRSCCMPKSVAPARVVTPSLR